jgi:hypothetical protein
MSDDLLPGWHEHLTADGYLLLGFRPHDIDFCANQDGVRINFLDGQNSAGTQVVLSHEQFAVFSAAVAKVRETAEAKRQEEGEEG